jgi:hypothetical protein
MKIRITNAKKDISLINRAFEQQEQTTNDVADLKKNVFTQVNLPIFTGAGSPNGHVVAAIGSLYLRTDGGAGTTLYVKESGSANSNVGWIPK